MSAKAIPREPPTAAIYLRLSRQDGDIEKGKDESNSIENQRLLLLSYLDEHPEIGGSVREYVDDGYTGTNFDRPGFTCMIEDAKHEAFQTILVKDFSRLGRDYIGVGDYVEQIFPLLGVRFIAVNNNFDSEANGSSMGLGMALGNLINTFYVQDIVKKHRSANETLWKRGYATASKVPFGYYWDSNRKGEWMLDPVSSKYVRRIFDLALEGKDTARIVRILNEEGIPTPGVYAKRRMDGRKENEQHLRWSTTYSKAPEEEQLWDTGKVRKILTRYEYTGALVMNKTQVLKQGNRRQLSIPQSERIVSEDAHAAIVTKEEFEQAGSVLNRYYEKTYHTAYNYPLKFKVFCGTCKRSLAYQDEVGGAVFLCMNKRKSGARSKCCAEKYPEAAINARVRYAIGRMTELASFLGEKLGDRQLPEQMNVPDARRLEMQVKVLKEERLRQYEGYADGVISRKDYLAKRAELGEQIEALQAEIDKINAFLKKEEEIIEGIREIRETKETVDAAEREEARQKERVLRRSGLTREMVDAFIEAVYIYDESRMEIVFKCEDVIRKAIDELVDEDGVLRL